MSAKHQDPRWAKLSKTRLRLAAAANEACCRCGRPINYELHGNHRYGPTTDHLDPLAAGGELIVPLELLGPAHRACNSSAGARVGNAIKAGRSSAPSGSTPPKAGNITHASAHSYASDMHNLTESSYNPPRFLSEPHKNAVGTLADIWIPWIEEFGGIRLREWQKVVLRRALEIDAAGQFCWRRVIVTTPRQSGKSWLIRALASARCQHSEYFGEPQEFAHVANALVAARRIHQKSWRWAQEIGLTVYRAFGYERIVWPEGSAWSLVSLPSIWGLTASTVALDEGWDIAEEIVSNGIWPTMVEAIQPQLWMFSTANPECTPLIPNHMRLAMADDPGVMLAWWGAEPGDDPMSPNTWKKASPYWDPQRHEFMRAASRAKGFKEQWLNIWPTIGTASFHWLAGWDDLPEIDSPKWNGIGSIELAADRSCYGAAVAKLAPDGIVDIRSMTTASFSEAIEWLKGSSPTVVLAGLSIKHEVERAHPWLVEGVGSKETRTATPYLPDLVKRRAIRKTDGPGVSDQIAGSRTAELEGGQMLSAKKSTSQIPAVKAIVWATWRAVEIPPGDPEIW